MTQKEILELQKILFKFHTAATLNVGSMSIKEGNQLLKEANEILLKDWERKS